MGFASVAKKSSRVTPSFNVGCMLDIPTGFPVTGAKGETIINGGLHHFTGGTGEANSAKTGFSLYQALTVIARYERSSLAIYDTEATLPLDRIINQAKHIAPELIENIDGYDSLKNVVLATTTEYSGDEFYTAFKKYGEERPKLKADYADTPFIEPADKKPIRILPPDIAFIDSFSRFGTKATEDIQDAAGIGNSKQNTLYLKDGLVKSQMLNELPIISGRNGLYWIMTAQLGENKQLDPYKAPRQTLSFLKNDLKLMRVTDGYRYGMHNLWFNFKMKPLLHSSKAPLYPRDSQENQAVGDTDLQEINMFNLRGKSGASGKLMTIIYSQSEGVKPTLSEFHFIKSEKFGLDDNGREYSLHLYPECKLTRTTIRKKIEEDPKLRVAIKLTSDLLQIQQEWKFLPSSLLCDAKTLFEDITKAGYDWNKLLETRSYWTFDQYTNPVPFLSIMDLLYMREGTYTPYWLENKK